MRRSVFLAVLVSVVLPATASAAASDLTETRRAQLTPRLLELGFRTPALPAETNVRVLLPDGYGADAAKRYPVLYLLHGCCDFDVDGSQGWTVHGEAEEATKGLPLIVVMPAGGKGGMYSDWTLPGALGRPQWESYHLDQLVPWVDEHFRTRAVREGRAIAGLSMGGFGTMKYAATHPDRFLAAAAFSGIVDSNVGDGSIHTVLPALDGGTPASVWGPRATDELRWRSQNPWDLAENLRPLDLTLRTGNGEAGPYDDAGSSDAIEAGVHEQNVSLHQRLEALGITHLYDDYGPGTHTWPYWARDLRQTLPHLMALFADPPAAPARVTYRSARPSFEVFGWRVTFRGRDDLAWSRLVDAGKAGFALEGTGTADVRLPAATDPSSSITVDGAPAAAVVQDGRITVPVVLSGDGKASVRITSPAARPRACSSRRVLIVALSRNVRSARATINARRLLVRKRRVRVDLRGRPAGTYTLIVRGTDQRGRPIRLIKRYRTCA